MDSVVKELNRIAEKKTGVNPNLEDMSDVVNYMSEHMTGTNPKEVTVGKALKYYADNYVASGDVNTDDATAIASDLAQGKTAYARGIRLVGTHQDLDTSDADAIAGDIAKDKTAYVKGVKVTGTHEDLDTSDATATASDITKNKTAYVKGVKITGTHEAGADGNFANFIDSTGISGSRITGAITKLPDNITITGASDLFRNCTQLIEAPQINTTGITHYVGTFQNCRALVDAPNYNTQDAYEFQNMFRDCVSLENVPEYDVTNIRTSAGFTNMFLNCPKLTYDSINNILAMCTKATMYNGPKNLYEVGIRTEPLRPGAPYDEATIKTLPNWQDFWMAGWTIE